MPRAANVIRTSSKSVILFVLFSLVFNISFASEGEGDKSFNAGEMIADHISDAHDWHLFDWDGHAVSVPLPVIVYHKEKGWDVFMSSKFNHSHDEYNGYRIMTRHYAEEHDINIAVFPLGKLVAMNNNQIDAESTAMIYDISITKNVTAMFTSIALLLIIFISCAKAYSKREGQAPKGLQSFMEPIIIFVRDEIAKNSIGEKKYEKFMPYLLTLFFFIWINNLMGLIPIIPGGANVTGNIAVPLVLALFTFIITTINGNAHYWKHIFAMPGVPKPILILLTPLEVLGIFIKPFVLVVRLFANITAGHIVILVFFSLIFIFGENSTTAGYGVSVASVAFSIFLFFLELLVGLIQAYVFTLLSAIYFGMATAEAHH
ncbi:F0F1 ATP synthase subunit A [bacterium AH-315-C07]|nr:F0F1 ATP synthase subunit A [bacterium AH-315-C07]